MDNQKPVFVTQAALPPLEEYMECVKDIFNSHMLTNQGKYVKNLEKGLAKFLDVPMLSLCANGTLALQLAIRMLGLNGKKVLTTPFTYVATASALLWEGCDVVLADIEPDTLCMDPAKIADILEEQPDMAGILPVHVFGNACDVAEIGKMAEERRLKVLYDAAHAFGSRFAGKSLLAYGDASICSFHSTKLFHTVEGGCIVSQNPDGYDKLALLRAFGHYGDSHICLGINAKMSEMHAAMGKCLLPYLPEMIAKRKRLVEIYDQSLKPWMDISIRKPLLRKGLEWNYAYYPVIFASHEIMNRAKDAMEKVEIHPRHYFYPSLSRLSYLKTAPCPVAEDIAERILCLPLWADMDEEIIFRIRDQLQSVL